MNLQEKINELEEKFGAEVSNLSEKLDKEIRELRLEVEQEENQEWVPDRQEEYWYVDLDTIEIINALWTNDRWDNGRLQHKVIFKTRAEAEEYLEYLKAKEKAMNEFSKEEWGDTGIFKYRFCINCSTRKFEIILETLSREFNALYFRQRHEVQEFINKYEKYLRRELGV